MNKLLLLPLLSMGVLPATAQTGADYLKAYKVADCTIPFDVNAEGEAFHVKWGMDTAWDWDFNVNRGIAHFGKGNFETGRVSFQPIDIVKDNGDGTYTLTDRQKYRMKKRIDMIKTTGVTEVNLNCDHEVLFKKVDNRGYCQDADDNTGTKNYQGKPMEWYKLIKASVIYAQEQGLKVVSVSPFNESDFVNWQQYSGTEENGMKDFLAIAKLIKEDDFFKDIRVCGGNTLNCDRALPWYNYLKAYLDEGNTHQLAGSFDNYAKFFSTVKADGKVATGDELHNVGEAIVGVQYGMDNGIWWGFDAKARGQFMKDSNKGVRLAYGEDRSHWTVGAVYRNEESGEVHGFLGSSERQANKSSYNFVSKTKPVFFNGEGPAYHWAYELPGGTGYQKGQINAELLVDITWGEDVAPGTINGTYQIMNERAKKLITMNGSANILCSTRKTSGTTQQWKVYPIQRGGDCSYYAIDNATPNTEAHLNLLNMNLNSGAGVICYNANHEDVEQWYLKYAGDGYYYIISRLSDKYLCCSGTTSGTEIRTMDAPTEKTTATILKGYRWRFMPVDAAVETNAPAAPTHLTARQRPASIELNWTAPTDEDVVSYTILRGENDEWNTIARGNTLTKFIDNNVSAGHTYSYKVIAVDYSGNRSTASDAIEAAPLAEKALVMQLQLDTDTKDLTNNQLDAAFYGTETHSKATSNFRSGTAALSFDGNSYIQLPYTVANNDEMTIAAWVKQSSGGSSWQRIFDFGNGTDQYMFLCPNNGSEMRFVMKNGGDEQILSAGRKLSVAAWHHLAVTIASGKVALYYDGEEIASSANFTIKPSDIAPVLNYVGRSQYKADPLYRGYLDDFRIYNYALSADEVKAITTDLGEVAESYKDSYEDIDATAINNISANSSNGSDDCFDLNGRKVTTLPANGVIVKNNKKQLVR